MLKLKPSNVAAMAPHHQHGGEQGQGQVGPAQPQALVGEPAQHQQGQRQGGHHTGQRHDPAEAQHRQEDAEAGQAHGPGEAQQHAQAGGHSLATAAPQPHRPDVTGQGGEPGGDLKAAIDRDLGGFAKMQTDFNAAGMRVFGSGWVFVVVTPAGGLSIVIKPNQDNPLMDGQRVLMGNDVWEHAYYLRYQNRRAEYLTNWWKVLNWEKIAARYDAARNGTLRI